MALQNAFASELRTDPAHAGRKKLKRHLLNKRNLDAKPRISSCNQVNVAKK